jgi:hypothetical protein
MVLRIFDTIFAERAYAIVFNPVITKAVFLVTPNVAKCYTKITSDQADDKIVIIKVINVQITYRLERAYANLKSLFLLFNFPS